MEVQRSARHRSLGIDCKSQPTTLTSKRPPISERHQSASLAIHARQNQARSTTTTTTNKAESPRIIPSQALAQKVAVARRRGIYPVVNFIVLGNSRVGKTSFIRNALDLNKSCSTLLPSNIVSLNGSRYRIRFCEIALQHFECGDGQLPKWPKPVGDVRFPRIDGVLCLYDVTNENSIIGIPQALVALTKSNLPVMLVACKADAPISEQEVGITFIERIRQNFPAATFGESSAVFAESAKKCLIIALKAVPIIERCDGELAETTDEEDGTLDNNTNVNNDEDVDQKDEPNLESHLDQTQTSNSAKPDATMPVTKKLTKKRSVASCGANSNSKEQNAATIILSSPDQCNDIHRTQSDQMKDDSDHVEKTFFMMGNDSSSSRSSDQSENHSDEVSPQLTNRGEIMEGGSSFSDLVDRLLRMPTTKSHAKFVPAFLCLYRAFMSPKRLLIAIIDRFISTDRSDLVTLTKIGELLRYLQVLAQWTGRYPGDFADPSTRGLAISFARDIELRKNFAPAAREIISNLLTIIMDDDQDWACEESQQDEEKLSKKLMTYSFYRAKRSSALNLDYENSEDEKDLRRRSVRNSGSASTTSSIVRSSVTSSQSATNLYKLDTAREQSKMFKTVPHIRLSKIQWHQFMDTPTEELAREITRIDWTMYAGIRARDFVRHVSLSSYKRAHLRHADTIGMMVKHFNHLALFVSGMILLRDKPKHRAKMLEKFMDLAWKVRQLNNYNSLGAIVAGITGPEISRLKSTHELISLDTQKQFLRLTVLMSISRSHAAYRMAWENSFSERIPFVPLVRQDLTMAASANQTFIGDNVNWKKFEIMGDVIVGIQRSHEQPYSFPERTQRNQDIIRLILETKVIDESEDSADPRSELYDRSVLLEPNAVGDGRKSMANPGVKRSMTGWFQS